MKLDLLLKNTGIPECADDGEREITAITCDSRRVVPGSVFVCINGTACDGHRFAADAERAGAAAVITERDLGLSTQRVTENTRLAWALLCANWFDNPATRLHMIGITGTNGKTTTATLIKSVLEADGRKVGMIGTVQNWIGDKAVGADHTTPDPYALQELLAQMVEAGCDTCVMEVSSHALDQERVAGCVFDVGVFTNLTQDHLDYHGTMEAYMAAKKRLFSLCRVGIFNRDDPWFERISEGVPCTVSTYSAGDDRADYVARNIRRRADGVDFELLGISQIGHVRMQIPGQFTVYNALAAATTCLSVGMAFDRVAEALSAAPGVKGRAEVVPTGRDFTVVIDFAHTPDGLENICRTLKECCPGRLITVFGCGGDRDRGKRPQMGAIAARLSDHVVVTSDNPRTEDPDAIIAEILTGLDGTDTPYRAIENRIEAIGWAIRNAAPGDTVLLAGKGHETYQILKNETIRLDEREVVAQALAALPR